MATNSEYKIFNDPIHGSIELHPLCVEIIDTLQFQRLRFIKQLGGNYFVYPGATHNRFEHSLGVCHLAGNMVRHLRSKQPDLGITDEDILCVEVAGLCHDLGHGPLSHLFEAFISRKLPQRKWKHEEASAAMFDHLLEENHIDLAKHKLVTEDDEDKEFIKQLFKPPKKDEVAKHIGRGRERPFLYQIVCNESSGVDVDKWDYFARDCHHLGMTSMFDHKRLIKFSRVNVTDGGKEICFRDKEVRNIYEMFNIRQTLHRKAYKHRITASVELMIQDAFFEADDDVKCATGKAGNDLSPSECIGDMTAYTMLTDNLYHTILNAKLPGPAEPPKPGLEKAKTILHRIAKRELYRLVAEARPKKGDNVQKDVVTSAEEALGKVVDKSKILIQLVNFNYGMGSDDPVDKVKFYTKQKPEEAIHKHKDMVSYMLPGVFQEQFIRVYCKDKADCDTVVKCFADWCKQKHIDLLHN